MAKKCTCQICKTKGTTDVFYKVTDDKGKNKYYCNKEEYDNFINEKIKRENLIKYIAEEVFQYEEGQIVPPVLLRKIKELHGFYGYEVIHECFKQNNETIQYWIKTKDFTSEYGMVSYIMKIIESNINDIFKDWKFVKQQQVKQETNELNLDIINELNTTKKIKKDNGILAFLDEEDM